MRSDWRSQLAAMQYLCKKKPKRYDLEFKKLIYSWHMFDRVDDMLFSLWLAPGHPRYIETR